MRIKLVEGKQRELLKKAKGTLTWQQFSEKIGEKKGAVLEWYKENNLIPKRVFDILSSKNEFEEFIVEVKEEGWGRSKGGINSSGSLKRINVPVESAELAEFVGIVLGDGNIHSYVDGKKVRVYSVRIAGGNKTEKEYHEDFVAPLCSKLFDLEANIWVSKNERTRFVCMYSKELVDFLEDMGLKSGNKTKSSVSIPGWIWEKEEYLISCLRGLIDTDGSVFRMSRQDPHLLRINFRNYNENLLRDVRKAFLKLGFHPSNITGKTVYLSRKKDIEKYINRIGFSNPKHTGRFEAFSKAP